MARLRSAENSDETDLATNDEYATRVASRTAERYYPFQKKLPPLL